MPSIHEKYEFIKVLGDGTFGVVSLAKKKLDGSMVAIKKMKQDFRSWDECMKLKEVQVLLKLKHVNIVTVHEVLKDENKLYFVFEYMKQNLYEMLKERGRKPFPEHTVRNIMIQLLKGVFFMHCHGYFHRDLKPENVLCQGPEIVKIADFGQAREIRSRPPFTDYIATRWYRAPEVQLGSTNYNSPVDIWALACIMAEVYTGQPLFPGTGTVDQIFKICKLLGTPTKATWSEGVALATTMSIRLSILVPSTLRSYIPTAGEDGLNVMKDMLQWDPRKRPTAGQVLKHKYFQVQVTATTGHSTKNAITTPKPTNTRGERGEEGNHLHLQYEARISQIKPKNNIVNVFNTQQNTNDTQHRKLWWNNRKSDSQDSGVDSELQQSNRSTGVTKPQAPPTELLATPTNTLHVMQPPFFTTTAPKKATPIRRKDVLPNIDLLSGNDQSRRRQWIATETNDITSNMTLIPTRKVQEFGNEKTSPWQSSKLPAIIDKKEAYNYYTKRSRYSPSVSGKSSKVGFGSSAPRFLSDASSPSSSGLLRPLPLLGRPRGGIEPSGSNTNTGNGSGVQSLLLQQQQYGANGRRNESQWNSAAPSQTGLISTGYVRTRAPAAPSLPVDRTSQNIPPLLGCSGALNRTDWTTRYSKRK